jgi:hypothetical protein
MCRYSGKLASASWGPLDLASFSKVFGVGIAEWNFTVTRNYSCSAWLNPPVTISISIICIFPNSSHTALSPHLPSPFIFPAFVPYPFALSMIFISAYEWVLGLKSKTYHRVTSRASKYYLPICDVSHVRVGLKTNVRKRERVNLWIYAMYCVCICPLPYIYINKYIYIYTVHA